MNIVVIFIKIYFIFYKNVLNILQQRQQLLRLQIGIYQQYFQLSMNPLDKLT